VLPVLYVNQDKKVSTADVTSIWMTSISPAYVSNTDIEVARAFGEGVRGGDSGNPIFTIVGNELVLLGCWHTGKNGDVIGSFPWLLAQKTAIESIIGQKLNVINMFEFKNI
jgi:hypothetical protein